jgi:hypothetical protein
VDDVRAVFDEGGGDASAGEGDTDLGVAREREGGDTDDGTRREGVGSAPYGSTTRFERCRELGGGGRSDDKGSVTAIDEVPGGLERAVGHAVHIGGKGFGHDDDSHTRVLAVLDVAASTWIFPAGERPVSVVSHTCPGQPPAMPS